MGIIHPEVLEQFGWGFPVSAIEIRVEELVNSFLG